MQHHNAHIQDGKGKKLATSEAIVEQFHNFYSKIYNLRESSGVLDDASRRLDAITNFLETSGLAALDADFTALLEAPLTVEEFEVALSQLKPGKSQGSDGLPTQHYKTFGKLLVPHLV